MALYAEKNPMAFVACAESLTCACQCHPLAETAQRQAVVIAWKKNFLTY